MNSTSPFAPFEWTLAWRYLRARRQEGFLSLIAGFSILGIALGVATLIIVLAVWNGFEKEFLDRILGFNGHVVLRAYEDTNGRGLIPDHEKLVADIKNEPRVVEATPYAEGAAIAQSARASLGVLLRGLDPKDVQGNRLLTGQVTEAAVKTLADGSGVILGKRLAEAAGVDVGESIRLISPEGDRTPFGIIPRTKDYTVAAVFEAGMFTIDNTFAFMSFDEAQLFFGYKGSATAIEVMLADPNDVECHSVGVSDCVTERIASLSADKAYLRDWRQSSVGFLSFVKEQRNVVALVLALIILVAALNIISSLTILVKDKTEDIAILRTMGTTRGAVMRIFLISGTSIGIVGAVLGLILGVSVAANIELIRDVIIYLTGSDPFSPEIYFIDQLPAQLDVWETSAVVIFAIGVAVLATLIPSRNAAQTDPVEALRYE